MAKKALIVYVSHTGNTEKVALRFKKVFDKKGWICNIDKINKTRRRPAFEDYDFICVGSPILAGVPAKQILQMFGSGGYIGGETATTPDILHVEPPTSRPGGGPPPGRDFPGGVPPWSPLVREPTKVKKGVAFVTYTGDRRGPPEALPSLALLEMYLEDQSFKCVGKFACPGKIWRKSSVDEVAQKYYRMNVEEASGAIARYQENPNDPEFVGFSKEDRAVFEAAIKTASDADPMWHLQKVWHWNVQNRPSERDLLKAEIFMEEILEDYYDDGLDVYPIAQYLCIA